MKIIQAFLSDGFDDEFGRASGAWTETIWARLAGWPVVALLSWGVWRMLPHGIHDWMSLSASTATDPGLLTFACSALFLLVICGYGPLVRLGPNWTGPTAAYLLFPFVAVALVRWTNLHGWSVPIIAFGSLLALRILLNILFALMDSALQAVERRYPVPTAPLQGANPTPGAYPYRSLGGTGLGFGLVPVHELSWHAVLTSRDPVLLRKAAQDARGCTPAWGCDASEIADILDRRAARYDNAGQVSE